MTQNIQSLSCYWNQFSRVYAVKGGMRYYGIVRCKLLLDEQGVYHF